MLLSTGLATKAATTSLVLILILVLVLVLVLESASEKYELTHIDFLLCDSERRTIAKNAIPMNERSIMESESCRAAACAQTTPTARLPTA